MLDIITGDEPHTKTNMSTMLLLLALVCLNQFPISESDDLFLLQHLGVGKSVSVGPDGLSSRFLKEAEQIVNPLTKNP